MLKIHSNPHVMTSLFKLITIVPSMDDCWMINIKAPAQLDVQTGEVDEEGFQVGLCWNPRKKTPPICNIRNLLPLPLGTWDTFPIQLNSSNSHFVWWNAGRSLTVWSNLTILIFLCQTALAALHPAGRAAVFFSNDSLVWGILSSLITLLISPLGELSKDKN